MAQISFSSESANNTIDESFSSLNRGALFTPDYFYISNIIENIQTFFDVLDSHYNNANSSNYQFTESITSDRFSLSGTYRGVDDLDVILEFGDDYVEFIANSIQVDYESSLRFDGYEEKPDRTISQITNENYPEISFNQLDFEFKSPNQIYEIEITGNFSASQLYNFSSSPIQAVWETSKIILTHDKSNIANLSQFKYEGDLSFNVLFAYGQQYFSLGDTSSQSFFEYITNDSDTLIGTEYDDYLDSGSGNDFINGSSGSDNLDGGIGSDTAIYSGNFSDYSFTRTSSSLELNDQRTGTNDGTDTLSNIEYIQFSDQTVDEAKVDVVKTYSGNFRDYKFYNKGNGVYEIKNSSTGTTDDITGYPSLQFTGEATTSSFREVSAIADIQDVFDQLTGLNTDSGEMFRLYNAAFARFPDTDGLEYWIEEFSSGRNSRRVVAESFLLSEEFGERYGTNVSDSTYVNTLYINVLGRNADFGGLTYWLGQLNSGAETRYEVLLGFAESDENLALFTEMTGFA